MNEPHAAESTITGEHGALEACPCREIVDTVRECLGISPAARQHRPTHASSFLRQSERC